MPHAEPQDILPERRNHHARKPLRSRHDRSLSDGGSSLQEGSDMETSLAMYPALASVSTDSTIEMTRSLSPHHVNITTDPAYGAVEQLSRSLSPHIIELPPRKPRKLRAPSLETIARPSSWDGATCLDEDAIPGKGPYCSGGNQDFRKTYPTKSHYDMHEHRNKKKEEYEYNDDDNSLNPYDMHEHRSKKKEKYEYNDNNYTNNDDSLMPYDMHEHRSNNKKEKYEYNDGIYQQKKQKRPQHHRQPHTFHGVKSSSHHPKHEYAYPEDTHSHHSSSDYNYHDKKSARHTSSTTKHEPYHDSYFPPTIRSSTTAYYGSDSDDDGNEHEPGRRRGNKSGIATPLPPYSNHNHNHLDAIRSYTQFSRNETEKFHSSRHGGAAGSDFDSGSGFGSRTHTRVPSASSDFDTSASMSMSTSKALEQMPRQGDASNPITKHNGNLLSQLLRSRRVGHLAQRALENENEREEVTREIQGLNRKLKGLGVEMKGIVSEMEGYGVEEEAMPSWMGEVRYWDMERWEGGNVGGFAGWEEWWGRRVGGGELENGGKGFGMGMGGKGGLLVRGRGGSETRERGESVVGGLKIWKRWGRKIIGRLANSLEAEWEGEGEGVGFENERAFAGDRYGNVKGDGKREKSVDSITRAGMGELEGKNQREGGGKGGGGGGYRFGGEKRNELR